MNDLGQGLNALIPDDTPTPSQGEGLSSVPPKSTDIPLEPQVSPVSAAIPLEKIAPDLPLVKDVNMTPIPASEPIAPKESFNPATSASSEPRAVSKEFSAKKDENQENIARLFAEAEKGVAKISDYIYHIELDKVRSNRDQPRRFFEEESLRELAASIREFGVLQPIVVTKIEKEVPAGTEVEYELISGERRAMACRLLGMERIPAIIRNVKLERERLELAIIENIQREDLNPVETARAFSRLQDEFRLTQREIASRLGKSREAVANTMRLLDLPPHIQVALEKGQISESHGRLLLAVTDQAAQEKLFYDLLNTRITTRELKKRVKALKPKQQSLPASGPSADLVAIQERLAQELGTPVEIQPSGEGGKVTISFYSKEELNHLIERLGGGEE